MSPVDEVVVYLELVPSTDKFLREFGFGLYLVRFWQFLPQFDESTEFEVLLLSFD